MGLTFLLSCPYCFWERKGWCDVRGWVSECMMKRTSMMIGIEGSKEDEERRGHKNALVPLACDTFGSYMPVSLLPLVWDDA